MRNVSCPEMYAVLMARAELERHWDPSIKRMTSRHNPFNLAHTTYLKIMNELKMHPYTKKKVHKQIQMSMFFMVKNVFTFLHFCIFTIFHFTSNLFTNVHPITIQVELLI